MYKRKTNKLGKMVGILYVLEPLDVLGVLVVLVSLDDFGLLVVLDSQFTSSGNVQNLDFTSKNNLKSTKLLITILASCHSLHLPFCTSFFNCISRVANRILRAIILVS